MHLRKSILAALVLIIASSSTMQDHFPKKAALKAYRNAMGDITDQPPQSSSARFIDRQAYITPAQAPDVVRNPNPDGGWMMVLDGQIRAEQYVDKQGKAICKIKNQLPKDFSR